LCHGQGEIFQDERLSMDEEAAQEASKQGHPDTLAGAGKSNDFRVDGVFADYGLLRTDRLFRDHEEIRKRSVSDQATRLEQV
jgi:hypothetical protein